MKERSGRSADDREFAHASYLDIVRYGEEIIPEISHSYFVPSVEHAGGIVMGSVISSRGEKIAFPLGAVSPDGMAYSTLMPIGRETDDDKMRQEY